MQFVISTTDEVLVPQAGLGLVGALLADTKLRRREEAVEVEGCPRPEVKHGDAVAAAIGLLCLGKTDFSNAIGKLVDMALQNPVKCSAKPGADSGAAASQDGSHDLARNDTSPCIPRAYAKRCNAAKTFKIVRKPKAEGKGFEPSTACAAPDFESGC